MVRVEISRTRTGNIIGFKVSGHAGHGTYGNDIVCSAVSALTQTAILGLENVAKVKFDYKIRDGYLMCTISDYQNSESEVKASAILETMYEGLKNIEESYSKYVSIVEKEEV